MGIPTVKFCFGCAGLVDCCYAVAVVRMLAYIVFVLYYLALTAIGQFAKYFNERGPTEASRCDEQQFIELLKVLAFAVAVNIFVTISFLIGIHKKKPDKMGYYVFTVGLSTLLFLFQLKVFFTFLALVEGYIFLCSYSLYKQYQNEYGGGTTTVVCTNVNVDQN